MRRVVSISVSRQGPVKASIDEALQPLGLEREIVTIVGGFCDRAGAGAGLGPDRECSRTAHRKSARGDA